MGLDGIGLDGMGLDGIGPDGIGLVYGNLDWNALLQLLTLIT